jgi:PAS domain S-box-containing protein
VAAVEAPVGTISPQDGWLHIAMANIADGVITCDPSGFVTFLNPVAEALTGWTLVAARGQSLNIVYRIMDEASRQAVENPATRALRTGDAVGTINHTVLVRSDGTESPIDNSAAVIRNAAGDVVGSVMICRDISDRKARDRLATEVHAYAENIIATLREPFMVLDDELRVQRANAAFYNTFGTSAGETLGRFIHDLGSRQWDIPRLRELLTGLLQHKNRIENFVVDIEFPTLGQRHMVLNARLIESPGKQSKLILLAIEDTTPDKQRANALLNSEIRYRRLFESAQDGILILDGKTMKVVDVNPYMTELLGYSRDEFIGKELWQLGFFPDKNESQAVFQALKLNGYSRYDHLPLEAKSGTVAEVEFVSNMYQEGENVVAQCNIRDISERSRLEKKAIEQTAELANLHRRKDEFLAMLGHELRNPLAPISNAVQLLRMQNDQSTQQLNAHAIIDRQFQQLTRLIDDLLEVSRITSGRVQLRPAWVAIHTIIDHAVNAVRPILDQRNHKVTLSVPTGPINLYADAARLQQVLVNLLMNAAKYTDEGGHIWLTVLQQGQKCVISIRDSGIGISADLLPHIFDLFTQADRSLDRSQGGLGIGLALVKHVVAMHQGTIESHSTLGQGSEFIVTLPVALSPRPQITPTSDPADVAAKGLRILVVDDNIDSTESMSQVLQLFGHTVRTAHDGPSALQATEAFVPNVILLDIGLPLMDGYEVATKMRQNPALANTTLVAMTGYGTDTDRRRAKSSGFDHHFLKPVDFAKLQEMLAAVADP